MQATSRLSALRAELDQSKAVLGMDTPGGEADLATIFGEDFEFYSLRGSNAHQSLHRLPLPSV